MIGSPSRKLVHRYHLANRTGHDIRIVDLINGKPCCGEVLAGKTLLNPGDETDVEVKLSVRQEFGDVVHDTVITTDPPQAEELMLRTMARAYPAIRIEESTPFNGSILLASEKPRQVELRVFACGDSAEPPVDLNRLALRSSLKVNWAGPKEEGPSEDGLRTESRRLTAWLDPAGEPGQRRTEIVLLDGEQACYRHVVSWETVSPIAVSPKMIVMRPGQRDYRVVVSARDHKLFRITRIECKAPGIQGRAVNNRAALAQSVQIEGVPPSAVGRGVVTVFTDHPAQAKIDVPFTAIE